MGIFSDLMLGYALTKLTNVHEEIMLLKGRGLIGADGLDALPKLRQQILTDQYLKNMGRLGKYPRHKVTHALFKNLQVAQAIGSEVRISSITTLFDVLVSEGYALDMDAFAASYMD